MAFSNTTVPVLKSIGVNNYNVTPFKVYKEFNFNESTIDLVSGSIYKAIFPSSNQFPSNKIPLGDTSYNSVLSNGKDQKIIWNTTYKSFYSDYNSLYYPNEKTKRFLYESANILSIPRKKIGEGIKKKSIYIRDKSPVGNDNIIVDDGIHNLIDNSISTDSIIDDSNLALYIGFNEKFNSNNKNNDYYGVVRDNSIYKNNGIINGSVQFNGGIPTTGNLVESSGYCCFFNGNGNIEIENSDNINFYEEDDFSISFWINLSNQQKDVSSEYNYILTKNRGSSTYNYFKDDKTYKTVQNDDYIPNFPFTIKAYNQSNENNGKIVFERKGGTNTTKITTNTICTGSYFHIVAQKTGSNVDIYVNGVKESTTNDVVNGHTHNGSNVYIGSNGKNLNNLVGSVDELRIYNRGLTQAEINHLSNNDYNTGSAYQSNVIGNVFYDSGILVVSDPRPKYKNTFQDEFDVKYNSTLTLYEHEILCKVKSGEFNTTTNPTIRINDNDQDERIKSFVTSSNWSPYITSIGLYNDKGQMVAIAKTGQPVKKRDDVDMNFLIRFDV